MNRKRFVVFMMFIDFLLIVSGCNRSKETDANKGKDREVVVGLVSEPDSVDIHRTSSTGEANIPLYDTLLKLDNDGNIVPNLITDYEVIGDGKEVIFNLKEDAVFHSGKPVNAEAVKLSFERLISSSPFSTNAGDIDSIEVLSDYSFKITWKDQFAPFFINATTPFLAPLDVSVLNGEGEGFEKNPSGSGPLKLVKINRGDSLVYEPYKDFNWESQKPGFDSVKFRFIPDEETRILEFKKGNVDVLLNVPYQYIEDLEKDSEVTIKRVQSDTLSYLGWNNKQPIFQDVKVRQALALAIDRESIIDNTLNGEAQAVFGPLPKTVFGYSEKIETMARDKYTRDIDAAKKLLAEAGWNETNKDGVVMKDGKEFSVELWVDDDPANQRAAQVIQNQLMEIGVKINIAVKESATIIEQTPKGVHEMLLWSYGWPDADVLNFLLFGKDKSKRLHYENEKIYSILDKAAIEMDQEDRSKLYEEAQEMLVEESPFIPLYVKENVTAIRNFESFDVHPINNTIEWTSVKVKE
ncbi:ABC transporter substrate-binding protein [Psychrobacillus lasiicapitis]|uniref:ABC transporter substrate-binding protein n=1 Tax=Psychrobacillus lasiicapitis TaxID=1636719 RepID=A0A544TBR2_9BACI|nr:ABC transporter substrate-binding protein [Psychrobacillus lasiicapitis]TQR14897.1 ABC transporter substrate-binding protein [Psychrobacillus lasiicapitis]GGA20880.1 peptide ABC transporter substrate-binding protein [Psychrobacillus lasiicapitis]